MRADRLLSLVLLLRNRGRMSASALAKELDVSERTVLRDIDALSLSGFPVYAERGRHGGFELLPGFTTDLTGLTADEAKALLAGPASESLGMGSAFSSAMRKVAASMSDEHRRAATTVAERVLVRPDGFLAEPAEPEPNLGLVQHAVFAGRRLHIVYGPDRGERTVDPLGLVHAGRNWYLLATHRGHERTYRLSRMARVTELDEPAQRSVDIDLAQMWDRRRAEFRGSRQTLRVTLKVRTTRLDEVTGHSLIVVKNQVSQGEWTEVDVVLGGERHALSVVWALAGDAEIVAPVEVREQARRHCQNVANLHAG